MYFGFSLLIHIEHKITTQLTRLVWWYNIDYSVQYCYAYHYYYLLLLLLFYYILITKTAKTATDTVRSQLTLPYRNYHIVVAWLGIIFY